MIDAADGPLIRSVTEDDLVQIADIYAHYVSNTYVTFELHVPSIDSWKRKWLTAQDKGHPWLLSEHDGEIHGYATTSTFNPKPAYRTTVETSIYLHHQRTGRGLGRALYRQLLELAMPGFHLAVAGIALPNDRSISLHESLGFKAVGVFQQVGHKLGEWRDVGWWQLPLSGPLT